MADEKKNPLGPTGHQVRVNLARLREARGLTKKQLSDAVGELGRPIPPLGISRIESGTRRVDVDDLVALAIVLGVNVSTMLLPFTDDHAEIADLTGVGAVSADRAWDWADGAMPIEAINPGDPEGRLLTWNFYARPPGRRENFYPAGED
ncbi:transcriptional regulator [Yinghuangia seranimata]|uniref:transcriptional regulator n=1 Tax=Yinghuangia seranimata TaxID=408067 RepID=UPI00248BFC0E|nr:transcriptional regulator [Yinghuangia seranimata]MDI2127942.1 helix-turn-helix domain-containing protein [Yinghuangia seranimata]